MARIRVYRTYNFIDKDPIIDKVRTVIQDEGLMAKLGIVSELAGVSKSTLDNWFEGITKRPQNYTVQAVVTSLGFESHFRRVEKIDVEKERVKAKRWAEKHRPKKKKTAKKKV